jgi:hypothetical protein
VLPRRPDIGAAQQRSPTVPGIQAEVSAELKEPMTKERKSEDVVKSAEQAAVLVLVY